MKELDHLSMLALFRQGGIIIYPTDTAFGIGCRIDNEKSVKRLFEIRKRAIDKAMPILVASPEMANMYIHPTALSQKIMDAYWPGAVTVVADAIKDHVLSSVRGGADTVGVRMPNHPELLSIIADLNVPITGSSANFAGGQTPYTLEDLDPDLVEFVDGVMVGKTSLRQPSTVVDCTGKIGKIIRQGNIVFRQEDLTV